MNGLETEQAAALRDVINQPTGATSAIGDSPSYSVQGDQQLAVCQSRGPAVAQSVRGQPVPARLRGCCRRRVRMRHRQSVRPTAFQAPPSPRRPSKPASAGTIPGASRACAGSTISTIRPRGARRRCSTTRTIPRPQSDRPDAPDGVMSVETRLCVSAPCSPTRAPDRSMPARRGLLLQG